MKTIQEIHSEAKRLTTLSERVLPQNRGVSTNDVSAALPLKLSEIPVHAVAPHFVRHVEAIQEGGEISYRLIERDLQSGETDRPIAGISNSVVMTSPSAFEVLKGGYELVEEERLAVMLEHYASRCEERAEPADRETVTEVEGILETRLVAPGERMRTRADVVDFLEGRLEPSAFITRAVERQCQRATLQERCVQRHEMKITIGET